MSKIKDLLRLYIRTIQVSYNYQKIKKEKCIKKNSKIRIGFIINMPQVWNSFRTVYEAAKDNDKIEVFLIATPKVQTDSNGNLNIVDAGAYDFCRVIDDKCINAYENEKIFDVENLKLDYVFYTRPYDYEYLPGYKMSDMCKRSFVCFIPYGYNLSKGAVWNYVLNDNLLKEFYIIFADSSEMQRFCKKRCLLVSHFKNTKKVVQCGFPRFDLCEYSKSDIVEQKNIKIMWIPRYTSPDIEEFEQSSFLKYRWKLEEFVIKNKKFNLITRPHPQLFIDYVKKGILSEDEVNKYKEFYKNNDNIELDKNEDYLPALIEADILVADFSSINIEFFMMGKPIIYFGSDTQLNTVGKMLYDGCYHANSIEEVEKIILSLSEGKDPLKNKRLKYIENIRTASNSNSGERIIDYIVKDYWRQDV